MAGVAANSPFGQIKHGVLQLMIVSGQSGLPLTSIASRSLASVCTVCVCVLVSFVPFSHGAKPLM